MGSARLVALSVTAVMALAVVACGEEEKRAVDCRQDRAPESEEVIFQAQARLGGSLDRRTLEQTAAKLCERLDALDLKDARVRIAGRDRIAITTTDGGRELQVVTTTGSLRFYDWEPNVLGERGPDAPFAGSKALFQAVELASNSKPKAERTDAAGQAEGTSMEQADHRNDTSAATYYAFDSPTKPVGGPASDCDALLDRLLAQGAQRPEGDGCKLVRRALGATGRVVKVPRGITIVEAERAPNQPESVKRLFVLEDDAELSGTDIKNPEQNVDPQTQEPILTMEFTGAGREAFARVTKRVAERGSQTILPPGTPPEASLQRFAITLDNKIVALATIDFRENPEGIDGRTGAQINGIGSTAQTRALAALLDLGELPVTLQELAIREPG